MPTRKRQLHLRAANGSARFHDHECRLLADCRPDDDGTVVHRQVADPYATLAIGRYREPKKDCLSINKAAAAPRRLLGPPPRLIVPAAIATAVEVHCRTV
jgi:hypothetical protein